MSGSGLTVKVKSTSAPIQPSISGVTVIIKVLGESVSFTKFIAGIPV